MRPSNYKEYKQVCSTCVYCFSLYYDGYEHSVCLHGEELPKRPADLRELSDQETMEKFKLEHACRFVVASGSCSKWSQENE